VDYLASTVNRRLDGLRLVVDCANGAASHLAPALFERLGARVEASGCAPDGRNINRDCGSLHLDALRRAVLASGADLGVAFDGDADRALFVAHSGRIVDGDAVLLICGRYLHEQGRLAHDGHEPVVVTTVMANLGLEVALRKAGIPMVRTAVGDKYVLEEMVRRGAVLGGEQSGHVIFRDFATTGDGMLTALRVLEVMLARGATLDALASELQVFPQLLLNVRVKEKRPLETLAAAQAEMRAAEAAFGDAGRIVVRFSGTEPLARVMVEASDADKVKHFAGRIADAIRAELGG
jgi:phosphoglucosamine mutase